jgi:hypothetical protein
VIASLREDDGRASVFKGSDNIRTDELIARLISRKHRIQRLDAGTIGLHYWRESSLADDEGMCEGALCVLVSGIDSEPHRTELHMKYGLLTITAARSGSKPRDKPSLHF